MTTYLLAGGGTAGHVNPLLATADAIRVTHPDARILVLGTKEGLEATLVPARGYELLTIDKVPFPRRPNAAALKFPRRFWRAVQRVRRIIAEESVDAVVGFGGYAATPAYLAARNRVPVIVHEANAMPGLANRLGARFAAATAVVFPNTKLPNAQVVGMPLRREIASLDRHTLRPEAMAYFGLDAARKTLVITGGSLGAKRINDTIRELGAELTTDSSADGPWQILHIVGRLSPFDDPNLPNYRVVEYCDRMELAFAAADFIIARAGASTVSELLAIGLPAMYVPYAVGNGEQARNIESVLRNDAAVTIADAQFTVDHVRPQLRALLADGARRDELASNAAKMGVNDAAERMVRLIDEQIRAAA